MSHTHTQLRRMDKREARQRRRPWPQIAVMLFLLAQAAGYVLLDSLNLTLVRDRLPVGGTVEEWFVIVVELAFTVIALAIAAASALFAVYSTLRRFRHAWMHSMLVQGIGLAVGLILYFGSKPIITYPILIGSLAAVVYLMLPGVQVAFLPLQEPQEKVTAGGSASQSKAAL